MSIMIDDSTRASTEGGIRAQIFYYVQHFPKWAILLSASLLLGLVLCVKSALALLIVIPTILLIWVYWSHIKAHFFRGDLCPCVVVSENPFLVAVYTDLTCGAGSYPVIKILKHPQLKGVPLKTGARLATAALYSPPTTDNHWEDFNPKIINCATRDGEALQRVFAKIPESCWNHFMQELSKIPQPYRIGIYPVTGGMTSY